MALYTPNEAPGSATPSRANIWAEIRKHSQIIPIANAAGRTALRASLAALTPPITPTPASPVWAYRQDTGAIECCTDPTGATWSTWLPYADTGWLTLPLAGASWTAVVGYTPEYRRISNTIYLRGMVKFAAGTYTDTIATMPVGYRPSSNTWLPPSVDASAGKPVVEMLVQPTGVISIPTGYFAGTISVGSTMSIAGTYAIG